jgi:8-oxo-dGTP diphosphatase
MIYKTKPSDFNKRFDIVGCFVQYDGKFVLLRRHLNKANGGKWGLPAGKKENGETIEQAILREVKEETGLTLSAPSVHHFLSLYVRDGSFDIEWHMFSTTLSTKPEIVIAPQEHSEFRWVTFAEALQMDDLIHDLRESIELFSKANMKFIHTKTLEPGSALSGNFLILNDIQLHGNNFPNSAQWYVKLMRLFIKQKTPGRIYSNNMRVFDAGNGRTGIEIRFPASDELRKRYEEARRDLSKFKLYTREDGIVISFDKTMAQRVKSYNHKAGEKVLNAHFNARAQLSDFEIDTQKGTAILRVILI